jgi:UDP-GlcNAc:undecaprenyl-phosphate GlcNAc-1-phosphate transferase
MMLVLSALACGMAGMLMAWILIPVIQKRCTPKEANWREFHHSHKTAVSRLGGLALAAVFAILSVIILLVFPEDGSATQSNLTIIFSSLAMFGLGFWDDLRPLGARKKLAGQILIASAVYFAGVQIESFKNPINEQIYSLGWASFPLTVFWLIAFTNLINLIDGIDGLAGGISLMLMCLLIYVGLGGAPFFHFIPIGMAGALLGFLYFNFPPAKIYMGDGGAYFLGFFIGIMTMANSHKGTVIMALIAPLFALALPIIDVTLAILRRGLKGLPIFRPDKKHIHHRLVQMGFSRVRTVLILYALSAVFLVLAFALLWQQGKLLPFLFGLLCVTLLVAAGSIRFAREWFAIGQVLGNSMEMRKEVRYALTLMRWFELESERSDSLNNLWTDFKFMVGKLGFARVRLILTDGEKNWERAPRLEGLKMRHVRHEFVKNNGVALEFEADEETVSEKLFEVLSDLCAETWVKALNSWQNSHQIPVVLESDLPATPAASAKSDYVPARPELV